MWVFGWYMLIEGAILLFFPNQLLVTIGLPPTDEVWIRVVGWAVIALGYYYIHAAHHNVEPFFRWTVVIRITQFFVFAAFVLLNLVGAIVIALASLELLSGLWTLFAIKRGRT